MIQLKSYLTVNSPHEIFQSGFNALHSPKSVLLGVSNDIFTKTNLKIQGFSLIRSECCVWFGQRWGPVDPFGDISGSLWYSISSVLIWLTGDSLFILVITSLTMESHRAQSLDRCCFPCICSLWCPCLISMEYLFTYTLMMTYVLLQCSLTTDLISVLILFYTVVFLYFSFIHSFVFLVVLFLFF